MDKKICCAALMLLIAAVPLLARAEMSTPILRTSPGEISLTTSFSGFESGSEYRIGIGVVGQTARNLQLNLLKNNNQISRSVEAFHQGYTSTWFNVESVQLQGYRVAGADLPASDGRLTLKITLPREEADRLGKFFIIVAKNYGADTWYLEDGSEVNKTHW